MVDPLLAVYVPVTLEMEIDARPKAQWLWEHLKHNSDSSPFVCLCAVMSERAMAKHMGAINNDTKDYDFYYTVDGIHPVLTMDNKNIQSKSGKLKSDYEAQVFDYNPNQDCDWYTFSRTITNEDETKASGILLIGAMTKADFTLKKVFHPKGSVRVDFRNRDNRNHTYKIDTNTVFIEQLDSLSKLKELAKTLIKDATVG
jgi:hypothetical protein